MLALQRPLAAEPRVQTLTTTGYLLRLLEGAAALHADRAWEQPEKPLRLKLDLHVMLLQRAPEAPVR